MAIATYTDLQTAIANWLPRADLTSRIPEFVTLCEAKLNRTLRCRQMEQRSTATATEYMELPTGFLELRNVQLNTTPKVPLRLAAPEYMDEWMSDASGKPRYYAVLANQIQLAPAPDGTYTVEVDYYEVIPPLASNSTNWLLTSHPDIYLYGSLLESAAFLSGSAEINVWQSAFQQCLGQLQSSDKRSKWSGSSMAVRSSSPVY